MYEIYADFKPGMTNRLGVLIGGTSVPVGANSSPMTWRQAEKRLATVLRKEDLVNYRIVQLLPSTRPGSTAWLAHELDGLLIPVPKRNH